MLCRNCGKELPENNIFCPFCLSQVELSNHNEPQKVEQQYRKEYIGNDYDNYHNTEMKVDSYIDEIERKLKEQSIYEKIYFLMEVVHNNITYDEKLKDFIQNKETKEGIFKVFYDYKNSASEVFRNKQGTCVGFSNAFKELCERSGIRCKILIYNNNSKEFYHQLNIINDNGKKYYVDPTWGFVIDDSEELKKIYRGEIPNPRTGVKIDTKTSEFNYENKEVRIFKKSHQIIYLIVKYLPWIIISALVLSIVIILILMQFKIIQ